MIFRENAKCELSWCVEPRNHEGYHYGKPSEPSGMGLVQVRYAPRGVGENSPIVAWEIRLPENVKKALTIRGNLPPVQLSLRQKLGLWCRKVFS